MERTVSLSFSLEASLWVKQQGEACIILQEIIIYIDTCSRATGVQLTYTLRHHQTALPLTPSRSKHALCVPSRDNFAYVHRKRLLHVTCALTTPCAMNMFYVHTLQPFSRRSFTYYLSAVDQPHHLVQSHRRRHHPHHLHHHHPLHHLPCSSQESRRVLVPCRVPTSH